MREHFAAATIEVPTTGSLTDDIIANATARPDVVAFSRRTGSEWTDVTAAEFLEQVRSVAKGLLATGLTVGDRVALLSRTRYEWTLLDYAVWYVGGVTVPIYPTTPPDQVSWILSDAGASILLVETEAQADFAGDLEASDGSPAAVWSIERGGIADLMTVGVQVSDGELETRRSAVSPSSLATVIYTSGTTGRAKGCMLTHGNLIYEISVALEELEPVFSRPGAATLLVLPLPHIFARIIQIGAVRAGVRLAHSTTVKRLPQDLSDAQPTFLLTVPRVLEQLFNTASQQAAVEGRGSRLDTAADTAIAYSKAQDTAAGPGPLLRARHRLFERLVYRRLRETLGGRCTHVIAGGAPLGERLGHFYRGVGLEVLEGYGLTETAGAVTVNRPGTVKMGTVGRPLPGTAVRVADDGELLTRGPQVFAGYWRDDDATAAAMCAGGWLRTGDLGEIDDEGFVRVSGRKQEVIVTAGGKTIVPSLLEERVRAHPLVDQCMVVGDGRPFVGALITLDNAAVATWANEGGAPHITGDTAARDADIRTEIQQAIDQANTGVSQAESIRRFTILPVPWTEESGHLTPSLKVRRAAVMRDFRRQVEALYDR